MESILGLHKSIKFQTQIYWPSNNRFTAGLRHIMGRNTDKNENQIFLIHKEIQSGAVAKSYMRKSLLIYEEMRK